MLDILILLCLDVAGLAGLYFVSEHSEVDEKTGEEWWVVGSDDWSTEDFSTDPDNPDHFRFRKRFRKQEKAREFAERRIRALEKLKREQGEPLEIAGKFVISDPENTENYWHGESREDALRLAAEDLVKREDRQLRLATPTSTTSESEVK